MASPSCCNLVKSTVDRSEMFIRVWVRVKEGGGRGCSMQGGGAVYTSILYSCAILSTTRILIVPSPNTPNYTYVHKHVCRREEDTRLNMLFTYIYTIMYIYIYMCIDPGSMPSPCDMYMCIHTCIYMYMYMYIYVYIHVYICI